LRALIQDTIVQQVIDCLDRTADLGTAATRRLLRARFEKAAGRAVYVPDFDQPRDWLIAFVEGCADLENGLSALVRTIEFMRPGSPATTSLQRLLDEWDAVEVALTAPPGLWDRLRTALSPVPLRVAAGGYHRAGLGGHPPAHCDNGWHLLAHAAARYEFPRTLPRWIGFLVHVADFLAPAVGAEVETWVRRFVVQRGLVSEYDRTRLEVGELTRVADKAAFSLVIQVEPALAGPDAVEMKCWYQWPRSPQFHLLRRRAVGRGELRQATDEALADVERLLSDTGVRIGLEMILPFDLINMQIETWLRRPVLGESTALIIEYPIVVRSLERLRHPELHREWRLRWAAHHNGQARASVIFAGGSEQPSAVSLAARIARDDTVTTLVLSAPPEHPDSPGMRELRSAVRSGLPIVAWHRRPVGPADEAALRTLFGGTDPGRLPESIRSLNLDRLNQGHESNRIVALLWDDPTRQPEGALHNGAAVRGASGDGPARPGETP
jgi:hypothetical protein